MRVLAGGKTDRGRKRRQNEDRILILPAASIEGRLLLAVADGMGGHAAGDRASARAIETFEAVVRQHTELPPRELLTLAIEMANRAVHQLSFKAPSKGAGTTLVAAVVEGSEVWIANVGDSRAYLVRDGEARQITTDHSWAEEEVRAGVLSRDAAASSKYKNVLTRNLGAAAEIAIDLFGPIALSNDDAIVLCSDGLHSVVSAQDIAKIARTYGPEDAAKRLVETAKAEGSMDDISVLVASAFVARET